MDEKRREFLESRRVGVGGSDVAPILGLSKWSTPYDVYLSKVGPIPEDDGSEDNQALHFGNVLEDVVAQEFVRRTGMKVQRRNKVYKHKDHPELLANIDRAIVGERAGLECKTSSAWMADQWGESGTDHVPVPYILQCQHYMEITGRKKWFIAALIGGNDFRWYPIPYNDSMAEFIKEKCLDFWHNNVEKQVPPAPINLEDVAKLYDTTTEVKSIVANDEIVKAILEMKAIKARCKELDNDEEELKLMIQTFMAEHNTVLSPTDGSVIATWKSSESNRLASKQLKEAHPELYAEYSTLSVSRRFLIK